MNVLIVDDDPDIRELVVFKLQQMGHTVHVEADGEAGLAATRALLPELVLLDVMMPKLTGIDVCRQIRATKLTEHIPVMLITAKAQKADIEAGLAAGANDYIVKPFSPRELAIRVEAVSARA